MSWSCRFPKIERLEDCADWQRHGQRRPMCTIRWRSHPATSGIDRKQMGVVEGVTGVMAQQCRGAATGAKASKAVWRGFRSVVFFFFCFWAVGGGGGGGCGWRGGGGARGGSGGWGPMPAISGQGGWSARSRGQRGWALGLGSTVWPRSQGAQGCGGAKGLPAPG